MGVVAAATAIGTPVAVVMASRSPTLAAGCVSTLRPGFMGGQTTTYCGKQAVVVCRARGAGDEALAAACRREGLAAR